MDWIERHQREARYVEGGRQWPYVDCFGWLRHAYAEQMGLRLPDWQAVTREGLLAEGRSLLEAGFLHGFTPVQTGCEAPFDAALINRPMEREGRAVRAFLHCGMVIRPGFIAHLAPGQGLAITCFRDCAEERASPMMPARHVRLYRPPQPEQARAALQAEAA